MVNALGKLLSSLVSWIQETLEVAGVTMVALFVGFRFGWVYVLAVVGVALLLKSLEVDLLSRNNKPGGRT